MAPNSLFDDIIFQIFFSLELLPLAEKFDNYFTE